jgi:hypothetical protein
MMASSKNTSKPKNVIARSPDLAPRKTKKPYEWDFLNEDRSAKIRHPIEPTDESERLPAESMAIEDGELFHYDLKSTFELG